MATLAEIIRAGVDDDSTLCRTCLAKCSKFRPCVSYADNALRTDELDELVRYGALGVALGISLEVAQVADMAVLISRRAMLLVKWVDCCPLESQETIFARVKPTVWASGCAAVGVVAKSVDVDASLGVGIVASDIPRDCGRAGLRGLLESHDTFDIGVSAKDCNYMGVSLLVSSVLQSTFDGFNGLSALRSLAQPPSPLLHDLLPTMRANDEQANTERASMPVGNMLIIPRNRRAKLGTAGEVVVRANGSVDVPALTILTQFDFCDWILIKLCTCLWWSWRYFAEGECRWAF